WVALDYGGGLLGCSGGEYLIEAKGDSKILEALGGVSSRGARVTADLVCREMSRWLFDRSSWKTMRET
ncbi:hypothetical protein, partial [Burkholderia pseudomallei]|uniref:hypothetical protein n=1 Tax=Burkholderia pseudomallei TaxID=28450 RepID=UPI001C83901B